MAVEMKLVSNLRNQLDRGNRVTPRLVNVAALRPTRVQINNAFANKKRAEIADHERKVIMLRKEMLECEKAILRLRKSLGEVSRKKMNLRGWFDRFSIRRSVRVNADTVDALGMDSLPRPAFKPQDLRDTARLPRSIFCPITNMPMSDPVMTCDGFSYEREAILRWFGMKKKTSPSSGLALLTTDVVSNHSLRATICELVISE
jgi:hypothetical protein